MHRSPHNNKVDYGWALIVPLVFIFSTAIFWVTLFVVFNLTLPLSIAFTVIASVIATWVLTRLMLRQERINNHNRKEMQFRSDSEAETLKQIDAMRRANSRIPTVTR